MSSISDLPYNPIYREFVLKNPGVDLEKYGFLEDNVRTYDWGGELNSTLRLKASESKAPAVLVFTGAFAPFHSGHAKAIRDASKIISDKGYDLVFTHVVPSNSDYLRSKGVSMSDTDRINSIKQHGFEVDTCCFGRKDSPDYPSVLLYVENLWEKSGVKPKIFNLVGSDNACFKDVVDSYKEGKISTIIINREEEEWRSRMSSTKIRNYGFTIFIKNDLDRSVASKLPIHKIVEFYESLGYRAILSDYVEDCLKFVQEMESKYTDVTFISLDTGIKLGQLMNVHRAFLPSEKMPFIGYSLETLPEIIGGRDYVILDDDVSTGGSVNFVRNYIENNGGKVVGVETVYKSSKSFDVIDLSDFLKGGGIYVFSKGEFFRKPYNELDLTRFASVPKEKIDDFKLILEDFINL